LTLSCRLETIPDGTITLPVHMFLDIQENIDPLGAAVPAALILLTAIVMIALRLFMRAGR
jgi:ABC-type spermidine/putrescine transport system permease subunit II